MMLRSHVPTASRGVVAPILLLVVLATGPALSNVRSRVEAPRSDANLAELWVEPAGERDLFYGPGGPALAPDPEARYKVIAIKIGGFSDGYTVRDDKNREWSAKFPPEASTEVVASRIHWGIGYHQPPIYFVREWDAEQATAPNPQLPARFREDKPMFHGLDRSESWSFADNPFVGTRQLAGLLVLQAMLTNSDLKPSNNALYTLQETVYGARRWYVVRDVGHTFGRTGVFESPRGDINSFEATGFIRGVTGTHVELEYGGRHQNLFEGITTSDVRWICERLNRLTDRQWHDAFRAGGYEPRIAERFIRKLRAKIAAGLALPDAERLESRARPDVDEQPAPRRLPTFAALRVAYQAERVSPDAMTLEEFRKRVEAFVDLHKKAEAKLPKLPDEATPQQIDDNQRKLGQMLRDGRANAKQGDIFTRDMQVLVRRIVAGILARPEGRQIKASIQDENSPGRRIRVNDRYPDTIPLTTMPPQLLKELPKMPEELEYRYVGDNLVILDPHAHLIVDFVPKALPE